MVWKETPKVGTMREFRDVDVYNNTNHPIRFFFKDTVVAWFSYKKFWFREKVWEFKHKYIPKHKYHIIDSGLPSGYHDIPELLLWTNFSFLIRYVEKEECFETIIWDGDDIHNCVAGELEDLYEWWKFQRPKREKIEDLLYSKVSDHLLGEATDDDKKIYVELNRLDILWHQQDIYNLKRLISIKDFMWS